MGRLPLLIVPYCFQIINYDIHWDDLNQEKNNFHIYFIMQQSILLLPQSHMQRKRILNENDNI